MWVSVSGRFFSLPWGTVHPEGPVPRKRTERDRELSGTHSSLATINNLVAATSHVCRVTLCMKSSDAWLQIFVYCCWVKIYRLLLWVALSSSIAKCQSGECTIFEEFLFVIFRQIWEEAAGECSRPISSAIHGKWIWNQTEHKNKNEKIYPALWMHPAPNCRSLPLSLFLSTTRIFHLYALGVSSVMLKKVALSQQKTHSFWKCGKTFPVVSKHKASPRCTGLLDQNTGLEVHTGCYFLCFFVLFLTSSMHHETL